MPRLRLSLFSRLTPLLASLLLVLATLAPRPAAAWGADGHEAVGAIADQLLAGTATGKRVRAILGGSLMNASIWADCARSVKLEKGQWIFDSADPWRPKDCDQFASAVNNKALIAFVRRNASRCDDRSSYAQCRHKAFHFVDIAIQQGHYAPTLPGANPHDLMHAIAAAMAVARGGKSPQGFDIASPREAVRLLAHYIGDLHQPLHVGSIYLSDAGQPLDPATQQEADAHDNSGGNSLLIEKSNLHHLWDDIPASMKAQLIGGAGASEARQVAATPGAVDGWPLAWADDTLAVAPKAFQPLTIGAKIPNQKSDQWPVTAHEPDYQHARAATQRAQIILAGARLAQLLTALFP